MRHALPSAQDATAFLHYLRELLAADDAPKVAVLDDVDEQQLSRQPLPISDHESSSANEEQ